MFEGAGDVVGRLAGLDAALDTGAHPLLAENTDQRPARRLEILVRLGKASPEDCGVTHRDAGDLGDGLHLLHVSNGDLGYPESAADVGPLGPGPGALHGAALVGTELAGRFDAEGAGAAQPGAAGNGRDPVTGLRQYN